MVWFLEVVLHLCLGSKAVLTQPQEGMCLELVVEDMKKILH